MTADVYTFLRKFLATLYLSGVNEIPFSGGAYTDGVNALQEYLFANISEDDYDRISDIFIKTPVQEEYAQLEDKLMHLNGDIVKFSAVDNPYWRFMTIKMPLFYAKKIIESQSNLSITQDEYKQAAINFCTAAGVL
jgi:hypothetical protein